MKSAMITHAQAGAVHAVGAALRVLITKSADGDYFVAQGLDIDYVATGHSEDEAKTRFAEGLVRTIHSLCKRKRSLEALFTKSRVPGEFLAEYFSASKQHMLHSVSVHTFGDELAEVADIIPRSIVFQRGEKLLSCG